METAKSQSDADRFFRMLVHLSRNIDACIEHTGRHSVQVAYWAQSTARYLGFSDASSKSLYRAALVHDIGKVAIPSAMLCKKGPLNFEEWRLMKLHPTIGANIVNHIPDVSHVAPWIEAHQEKFDGTGYPHGLRGDQIPIEARVLTVVDSFNAMTSERCYRRALDREIAIFELHSKSGSHFDPKVVETFLAVIQ